MRIIWFVNFAILFAFIKVFEVPSMIPVFVDELNISYAEAGIFMTVYTLIRCLASLPAGSITDRWGAIPVISTCLLFIAILGTLATFSSSYPVLLTLRALVSIGISIIFIASVDAIPKYLPPENVGRGIGFINGSLNIGIALALFTTPILADSLGWRWTARIYSLSFLLLFACSIPLLRNLPKALQANDPGPAADPVSISALLRNPAVMLLALAAFIIFVEIYGLLTWVPVFLAEAYQYSPAQIGTGATMFGIAAIPASIICGFLCTNLNRITWLSISGGIMAGSGILVLVLAPVLPLWLTVVVITLITWGHSQVIVTIMSIASMVVPPRSSGKALGVIFTFGYAGSILPTYLGGFLLEETGKYDLSFIIFAASAFVSIFAMLAVIRILHRHPPSHFKLRFND